MNHKDFGCSDAKWEMLLSAIYEGLLDLATSSAGSERMIKELEAFHDTGQFSSPYSLGVQGVDRVFKTIQDNRYLLPYNASMGDYWVGVLLGLRDWPSWVEPEDFNS